MTPFNIFETPHGTVEAAGSSNAGDDTLTRSPELRRVETEWSTQTWCRDAGPLQQVPEGIVDVFDEFMLVETTMYAIPATANGFCGS